jgi:hypothetical protein
MNAINKAYAIIFGKSPEGLRGWQIAEEVIRSFDVNKLGEELAKEVIYEVVLYVDYPDRETTTRVVGRAEGLAGELWDDLPGEVHMADLERKRYSEMLQSEKNKKLH